MAKKHIAGIAADREAPVAGHAREISINDYFLAAKKNRIAGSVRTPPRTSMFPAP